jgi:N-acetylglucosaminyl-diphospho-decaprenol L-rhamnosyltransferase
VTVTFNSAGCVLECLRSLERRLPSAERIVVDNASTDGTPELVEAESPGTRVIRTGRNLGFGQGCNAGVDAASNEHVLLVNPDVSIVEVDEPGLARLESLPDLGLVAPLLSADAGSPARSQLYRPRHWLVEALDHGLGPLRPRGGGAPRLAAAGDGRAWASGALLLVRRSEFQRVGGFATDLFLYYEDRDLSARYAEAGLPIGSTDALRGVHAGGRGSAVAGEGADRMAYSFLGFVEYLHGHRGERTARRAAAVTTASSGAARAAVAIAARVSGRAERLERKRRQLEEFGRLVRGEGKLPLPPGADSYRHARAILRSG